jgi:predicted DNA-binding protein (UPF0251 family)
MPRPRKCRLVQTQPAVTCFTPLGACAREIQAVRLSLEGLEALRLADLEGLRQEQAAARMGVSRQTFGRVLAEARRSLAQTVVFGRSRRTVELLLSFILDRLGAKDAIYPAWQAD